MGSSSSDMTESEFRQEWVQKENTGETVIWQNKRFPDERLEQFRVRDGERDYSEKLYKARNSSQYIVKGYHLANEGFSCSADYDTSSSLDLFRKNIRGGYQTQIIRGRAYPLP